MEGRRESIGPPPPPPPASIINTIHPIDMKFGTYNKLHLYFQLNEYTRCLIRFHGNNIQINNVTGGLHLGFLNFQILFKFSRYLVVEIQKNARIRCEVVSI